MGRTGDSAGGGGSLICLKKGKYNGLAESPYISVLDPSVLSLFMSITTLFRDAKLILMYTELPKKVSLVGLFEETTI